jgi:hypothetical protein
MKTNATAYADNLMRRNAHAIQHRTENGKPCSVCSCGWRTEAETYGARREAVYQHFDKASKP